MGSEVERRIRMMMQTVGAIKKVYECSEISREAKVTVFEAVVIPILTYGCELWVLRRCSHYGENDGDGTVTFRCSHHTFCNVAVTVSLPSRRWRRDNGCHGDGHGRKREVGEVGADDGATWTTT